MKAAIRTQYGFPDVLTVEEIQQPIPRENELLVKVYAATVNRTDCGILTGKPAVIRLFSGLLEPSDATTGTDFAGLVVAVGSQVTAYKAGDKIWGFNDAGLRSHAGYMVVPQNEAIEIIPEGITYEQAAASIEGAHYAYNFIKKVPLGGSRKVLLNGATGAIGSAALQMLKYYGAEVTAVGNTPNLNLLKSMGADRVIDYTAEDFTQDREQYDFVFDAVGKSTFGKCKSILKPGGVYISSELGPNGENPFLALWTPVTRGKQVRFPLPTDRKGSIGFIKKLLEEGKFRPVIDRRYPLEDIAEAFRYVLTGQKTGNVIIICNQDGERA
ncbi:NAD(P)-dependent alcohol dehydrogenase [Prolixibacter denitrificans]|uniref:NADPH:quinone oxidoreductase n=1 Tax=Prolixibacter denitrificans TaxID=1541063 RepID=A0A2P8CF75_9BACT|nr:NAD(P)-dependent alcohol dehydrogenase [Prolixibacter denitrificans]PSK83596.1 NADPH:quinone reductase-like Zn-dependent oxidoreductase [Prolixibacter denitrificans]GET23145.1 NADPH:quinone oxidoreductase [Prolixibacter denitrificans]